MTTYILRLSPGLPGLWRGWRGQDEASLSGKHDPVLRRPQERSLHHYIEEKSSHYSYEDCDDILFICIFSKHSRADLIASICIVISKLKLIFVNFEC